MATMNLFTRKEMSALIALWIAGAAVYGLLKLIDPPTQGHDPSREIDFRCAHLPPNSNDLMICEKKMRGVTVLDR